MKNILRLVVVFLLTFEAQLILKKYRPEIIAITGSVGKTSAKDAIATALGDSPDIRKSKKSQNSDIGVPLTVIGAENQWESFFGWLGVLIRGCITAFGRKTYPQTLILEVGADHPGDIAAIAPWLKPDIVVMTGVSDIPVHIAFFDSADAILAEKAELVRHMRGGGTLILNGDNERARKLSREHSAGTTVTYGMASTNNLFASHMEPLIAEGYPRPSGAEQWSHDRNPRTQRAEQWSHDRGSRGDDERSLLWYRGMRFRVNHGVTSVPFELKGVIGEPHLLAVLSGCAVALARGENLATVSQRFLAHEPPPGRMRLLDGLSGSTIIDDSYNSSPDAAIAALNALKNLTVKGRRIAALGDMRELGVYSHEAHDAVGTRVAQSADLLITVGEESRVIAETAHAAGMGAEKIKSYGYGESAKAGKEMARQLRSGDVILVEGSQNMIRMEQFVKEIMAEPNRASELLVRPAPAWLVR